MFWGDLHSSNIQKPRPIRVCPKCCTNHYQEPEKVPTLENALIMPMIGRGSWILLNQPTPSRSPQNSVKNRNFFFAFLKVHNELGKVTKFGTSKPLFSWRNSHHMMYPVHYIMYPIHHMMATPIHLMMDPKSSK